MRASRAAKVVVPHACPSVSAALRSKLKRETVMPDARSKERATYIAALATIAGAFLTFLLFIVADWEQGYWPRIIENHFAAVVGLPLAAAAAFIIVTLLRQGQGELEFEGLGFKFRGPSGQIVLWLLCFLGIAGAIKLLW
jgi:hypothetical protein